MWAKRSGSSGYPTVNDVHGRLPGRTAVSPPRSVLQRVVLPASTHHYSYLRRRRTLEESGDTPWLSGELGVEPGAMAEARIEKLSFNPITWARALGFISFHVRRLRYLSWWTSGRSLTATTLSGGTAFVLGQEM